MKTRPADPKFDQTRAQIDATEGARPRCLSNWRKSVTSVASKIVRPLADLLNANPTAVRRQARLPKWRNSNE